MLWKLHRKGVGRGGGLQDTFKALKMFHKFKGFWMRPDSVPCKSLCFPKNLGVWVCKLRTQSVVLGGRIRYESNLKFPKGGNRIQGKSQCGSVAKRDLGEENCLWILIFSEMLCSPKHDPFLWLHHSSVQTIKKKKQEGAGEGREQRRWGREEVEWGRRIP